MNFRELQKKYTELQDKYQELSRKIQKQKRFLNTSDQFNQHDALEKIKEHDAGQRELLKKQGELLTAPDKPQRQSVIFRRPETIHQLDAEEQSELLERIYEILKINQNAEELLDFFTLQQNTSELKLIMPKDLIPELVSKLDAGTTEGRRLEQDYEILDIIIEPKKDKTQKYLSVTSSLFVDRKKERSQLDAFLKEPEFFVWNIHTNGEGGIGKTQVLIKLLEHCNIKHAEQVLPGKELIDIYHTESRSKAGIVKQVIRTLEHAANFESLKKELKKYQDTEDSSERQFLLEQILNNFARQYDEIATKAKAAGKIIVLFFDTYEVIQSIQEKNAEPTEFSTWFESEFLPCIRPNTKVIIAGRYLLNHTEVPVQPHELTIFQSDDAVEFLIECQKIARFYPKEYQKMLEQFHEAEKLLQPVQRTLPDPDNRIEILLYELTEQQLQKDLGEETHRRLIEKTDVKDEEDLLAELQITKDELQKVLELSGNRPIYLALLMDWVRHNAGRRILSELLVKIYQQTDNIREKSTKLDEQEKLFKQAIIEQVEHRYSERTFILSMVVAYRRMTPKIMQYLTRYPLKYCKKVLLQGLRELSFIKYKNKEDEKKSEREDVVLLHDEVRDLLDKHWDDPSFHQHIEIAEKVVRYYDEALLSPDYKITSKSIEKLQQQLPDEMLDILNSLINRRFASKIEFRAALKDRFNTKEMDAYVDILLAAARIEVSQEKREVYTPELIEYAFMVDCKNGLQRFRNEFVIAMDDGRHSYAEMLLREVEFCYKKYCHLDDEVEHEIELRKIQYALDTDKHRLKELLQRIALVKGGMEKDNKEQSALYGQFLLQEGIAEFWQDNFDRTVKLLKRARKIFIRIEDQEASVFLANNWIGYTLYRKGDFSEARRWMQESLEGLLDWLSKELDDADKVTTRNIQQHIQYALGNLALLDRYTGRFFHAIQYAEIALNIVENLPRNKKETLRSLNTLGHVLAIAGRNIDARFYLKEAEKIYKEIPDRLLGGRVYSNFCQLYYGTMEFAYLVEYYRAEELHQAIKLSRGRNIGKYVRYAKKAIHLLEMEPALHKELSDAYFSLGELYMMMPPAKLRGAKWALAERAFERALNSARKSKFTFRIIDTLESLVTMYYFQSRAGEELSREEKKKSLEKLEQYQGEIDKQRGWLQCYPNLMGRYELTQGDIHFDEALDLLEGDKFTEGTEQLEKAFDHYIESASYKMKFNKDRYHLMLRVIYNRLNTLVDLAYPIHFPRLAGLEQNSRQGMWKERNIPNESIGCLENKRSRWEDKIEDFKWIFDQVLLLKERKVEEEKLKEFADKVTRNERQGKYWEAVLVNKCLTELYWTQVHTDTVTDSEKEKYREQLVLQLNQQSRLYRLMGDYYHAKRSYQRAKKIIATMPDSPLKKGLEGHTNIIEGEYLFRRGEFGKLLESIVGGELQGARTSFENQFPGELEEARALFAKGEKLLLEALEGDLSNKHSYQQKLSEAYFQLGEFFMIQGNFPEAFRYLKNCIAICEKSENNFRLDDAKQSYLSAVYFSGRDDDTVYQKDIEQELEKKTKAENYEFPWVAAKFRITQGDVLFNRYFQAKQQRLQKASASPKFKVKEQPERKDIVDMFRKYTEACNYKARFNDASFAAGIRVLRRRIEMIPDSRSLDILSEVLRQIWQDGEQLREKKEELEDILQLVWMRSLILQHQEQ
jgi:hypothetical protein